MWNRLWIGAVAHFGTPTLTQRFVPVTRRHIALDRPVTHQPQIGIAFKVDAVARALHLSDVERQMGAGTQTFWNGRPLAGHRIAGAHLRPARVHVKRLITLVRDQSAFSMNRFADDIPTNWNRRPPTMITYLI